MARFNMEQSKNYGVQGSSFFSLKDDKDTAKVRFLLNDINDLYGVSCHEVEVDGKTVDVECLRAYNEPIDKCPLCAAGYQVKAKLFIPLYDETSGESKIWARGKTYFDKIAGLCARNNPLVGSPMEIERHGRKGDTQTTYEIYNAGRPDNSRIEDFPEINPEGIAFQVKSYQELQNYLRTKSFDGGQSTEGQGNGQPRRMPVRRPSANPDEEVF